MEKYADFISELEPSRPNDLTNMMVQLQDIQQFMAGGDELTESTALTWNSMSMTGYAVLIALTLSLIASVVIYLCCYRHPKVAPATIKEDSNSNTNTTCIKVRFLESSV